MSHQSIWSERFGELRSLLGTQRIDEKHLWSWIIQTKDVFESDYQSQALPYIQDILTRRNIVPKASIGSMPMLSDALQFAPFFIFKIQLRAPALELVSSPTMKRIYSIDIHGDFDTTDTIDQLVKNPATCHLTDLALTGKSVNLDNIRKLVLCDNMTNLTGLYLGHAKPAKMTWLPMLLGSQVAKQLTELSLTNLGLAQNHIRQLAQLNDDQLRYLDLSSNTMDAHCAQSLTQLKSLSKLTHLHISNNRLGNEGLQRLLSTQTFPWQLKVLNIGNTCRHEPPPNDRASPWATALAEGALMQHVHTLYLGSNPLTIHNARVLSDTFHANIKSLNLNSTYITDDVIEVLVTNPKLAGLTDLSLSSNNLTDLGVKHIARSRHMANLKHLDLFFNQRLTNKSANAIAMSRHMSNLTTLELRGAKITKLGVERLLESRYLTQTLKDKWTRRQPNGQFY